VPHHTQGTGQAVNGDQFTRPTLQSPANNAVIDAWLTHQVDLGTHAAHPLTPVQVEELHKLGYIPQDIINNAGDVRALDLDGNNLDGINAILTYHKGFE